MAPRAHILHILVEFLHTSVVPTSFQKEISSDSSGNVYAKLMKTLILTCFDSSGGQEYIVNIHLNLLLIYLQTRFNVNSKNFFMKWPKRSFLPILASLRVKKGSQIWPPGIIVYMIANSTVLLSTLLCTCKPNIWTISYKLRELIDSVWKKKLMDGWMMDQG